MEEALMHTCRRCGYQTKVKQCLKRHLQRKTPCVATQEDVAVSVLLEAFSANHHGASHACEFCHKTFYHASNKSRHKQICKEKPEDPVLSMITSMNEKIEHMSERLETPPPPTTQNVQTNCNNTNNTNNICIQVNALGREDTSHLSHAFLSRCVRKTNAGLVDLLEKLHFDPDVRENANIRVSGICKRAPLVEYNDGERWRLAKREKVLNQMIDKGQDILQEHFDDNATEIKDQVSETMYAYIVDYFDAMANADKRTMQGLLTDIYILLLNNTP